jgi:TPR repeat protein
MVCGSWCRAVAVVVALVVVGCGKSDDPPETQQLDRLLNAVACGKGDETACARHLATNRERCTGGDTQGCVLLGITFQVGREAPKDEALAVKFFEQACNAGDANGCWYLGSCHQQGRGTAKDLTHAMALYQKGCDLGEVNACADVGTLYEFGRGVPADPERALAAYDRACRMRDGSYVCETAKALRARLAK